MDWIPIKELDDTMEIWAGNKVRIYNAQNDYLDYLVSYIFDNNEFLQLTCLSQGEAGNICCVLKKELPHNFATAKELKRMIGIENTFFNPST